MNISVLSEAFPLLLLLIGLSFTVLIDPYLKKNNRRVMLAVLSGAKKKIRAEKKRQKEILAD